MGRGTSPPSILVSKRSQPRLKNESAQDGRSQPLCTSVNTYSSCSTLSNCPFKWIHTYPDTHIHTMSCCPTHNPFPSRPSPCSREFNGSTPRLLVLCPHSHPHRPRKSLLLSNG